MGSVEMKKGQEAEGLWNSFTFYDISTIQKKQVYNVEKQKKTCKIRLVWDGREVFK